MSPDNGIMVEIGQEQAGRIEQIMEGLECPKSFACYRSGFTQLCPVRGIGTAGFLKCLEPASHNCQFSLPYGRPAACLCPLRIYIATELHR